MADLMLALKILWVAMILLLFAVAFLFLRGALSVERDARDSDKDCICKKTRFAVYANADCPIHGEPQ